MYKIRIVLCLSGLLLAALACNAASGIRTAQTEIPAALTKAPAVLTEAPTALGSIETSVAELTPLVELTSSPSDETPSAESTSEPSNETPSADGLGIKLEDVKTVLQVSQQFAFSDGTEGDKPASIAKLTSTAASTFPSLAAGFSAKFIGDPNNLDKIKVTLPRTEDKTTVDEGIGLLSAMFAGILPVDVQVGFLTWMSQNYSAIPINGSKETTVNNFKFTLSRSDNEMELEIEPAK